ncbi:class I SAM-dependent methyltransferase [Lysinibacillus parviboronicapiens]|uniref:class I SAM-dependent methyltransferase n=1 Tax=Lysinibacillus parviboronicapiens TaxID=436516 RepID=UPI000D37B401|nr:hypothetical protein [Lysinibacillus parviboronicapiens]
MLDLIDKKLIFWGTGSLSKKKYCNILLNSLPVDIECFIDNDKTKVGLMLFDKKIHHSEEIHNLMTSEHCIVICSSFEKEIINQLGHMRFKQQIDFITYREFDDYLGYLTASEQIKYYDKLKVIIGASQTNQKGWISTDKPYLDVLKQEDWKNLFGGREINSIVAEHVWEHLTYEQGVIAAKNCFHYLEKGGRLRIAVPDGNHPNPHYISWIKPDGFGDGAEDHKVLYTVDMITGLLKNAGFSTVDIIEYFDESGNFHQSDWKLEHGFISRSKDNDSRNWHGNNVYSSLIVDGIK